MGQTQIFIMLSSSFEIKMNFSNMNSLLATLRGDEIEHTITFTNEEGTLLLIL